MKQLQIQRSPVDRNVGGSESRNTKSKYKLMKQSQIQTKANTQV